MNYKDYYKILGVTKGATPDEIKQAYRKLALAHHPDKNPGDKTAAQKFSEISEANEVLTNSEKRKKYDEFGQDPKDAQDMGADSARERGWSERVRRSAGTGDGATFHFAGDRADGIPDDFFEMLFGQKFSGGSARPASFRGTDALVEAPITLEEAYRGTTRMIEVDRQTIRVKIKPGSSDQQILRVPGKGGPGHNGPAGDLLIRLILLPHSFYERRQNDLYCSVPVDVYTALLGGSIKVKTLKGTVKFTVPAETPNGRLLKLAGLGVPLLGGKNKHGDLYARVEIQLPTNLSDEEKGLFDRLRELNTSRRG